jgi:hypothetical protein
MYEHRAEGDPRDPAVPDLQPSEGGASEPRDGRIASGEEDDEGGGAEGEYGGSVCEVADVLMNGEGALSLGEAGKVRVKELRDLKGKAKAYKMLVWRKV